MEDTGRGARNRLHCPHHLPTSSIPPSGRARWAVLSIWQVRWFSRTCRPVPCLLCLHSVSWLQTGRHLIFQQPISFSTGTGVKNLQNSAWFQDQPLPFICPSTASSCTAGLLPAATVLAQLGSHLQAAQFCMNAGVMRLYLLWEQAEASGPDSSLNP